MEITDEKIAWVKRYRVEYEALWKSYQGYIKTYQSKLEEKVKLGIKVKPENVTWELDFAYHHAIRHVFGREFADMEITPLELQTIFKLLNDGNNVR